MHHGVGFDAAGHVRVGVHRLRNGLRGVGGGDGGVEVDLDDVQRRDAQLRARGLGELAVRLDHAAQQRLHRIGNRQVGRRVVAHQQAGQLDAVGRFGAAGHRAAVQHVHQVAQAGGAHRVGQFAHRQRAVVLAQPRHHRAAVAAALALERRARQQHRAGRADGPGVQAQVMANAQLAVHQFLVDQGLGTRDGVLLVVAHEQGLVDLAQVHGVHAHLQRVARALARPQTLGAAKQAAGQLGVARVGHRPGVIARHLRRGRCSLQAAQGRRTGHQRAAGAVFEQLGDGVEVGTRVGQFAVPGRHPEKAADAVDAA